MLWRTRNIRLNYLISLRRLASQMKYFSYCTIRVLEGGETRSSRHRSYCETVSSFQPDGDAERDQRRLEFVLQKYRAGGFQPGRADVFIQLANKAFAEIPPFKTVGKRVPIRESTISDGPKRRIVRRELRTLLCRLATDQEPIFVREG